MCCVRENIEARDVIDPVLSLFATLAPVVVSVPLGPAIPGAAKPQPGVKRFA